VHAPGPLPHKPPETPALLPTLPPRPSGHAAGLASPEELTARRDTGHLKEVPESKSLRERIRAAAVEVAGALEKSRPLGRSELESAARALLRELGLAESYAGWTMVALASAFWHEQVAAVPCDRRLLLLPRCMRKTAVCTAECDAVGLQCRDCGACALSDLRAEAQRRGYRVLIAEGSPAVMKIILGGHVDALLGVACLDALEKTLDKVLLAGIPCMAVPLLGNGCRDTSVDLDWVAEMIGSPHRPAAAHTPTYLHLMRCAAQMFEPAELERLVPRQRSQGGRGYRGQGTGDSGQWSVAGPQIPQEGTGSGHPISNLKSQISDPDTNPQSLIPNPSPLASTEAIAHDFLALGGKHSRPFITLAAYDALTGGRGTLADGPQRVAELPDAAKRVALAIEIFHKASLVHDDVEDDDWFRYGQPTLHRKYGMATAINVGDYLIGLGYRLVAAQRQVLGAEPTADILAQFADAHTRLCEGQGAELLWRDARNKVLPPLDALKIYALKTAPAFEAALLAGIRLAGPAGPYRDAAVRFARHLGVAYQILNDLDDWCEHGANERPSGADLLGRRPTVLWALALAGLRDSDRCELEALPGKPAADDATIARARELYERAGAFRQAAALVTKHHERACLAADTIDSAPLRHLLHFLADAILDRRPLAISEE
jgi:geranylgeranyl pyrophosphate synthase